MKYLKLRARPLHILKIDLDTFHYPKLHLSKYTDRNGWNEMEEILTVYSRTPAGSQQFTFFYSTTPSEWAGVAEEVAEANRDPKKFWAEHLNSLLLEERASLETQIERTKAQLKHVKKMQKKLGKDS